MIKKLPAIGIVALVSLAAGAVAVQALPPDAGDPATLRRGADAPFGVTSGTSGRVTVAESGPLADLSESEVEALHMALEDEYKAWTVYDQVIVDFGQVRPFTNIRRAEENHIAALVTLFQRYGLGVPINDWPGRVPTFESVAQACEAGVQAEIENAALYDQLFAMVDNPDIIQVFFALQQASQTKHLPAFKRCASGALSRTPSAFVPMVNR